MALATSTVDRFGPSLVETSDGGTVPLEHLLEDDHGIECHADAHFDPADSAQAARSFNLLSPHSPSGTPARRCWIGSTSRVPGVSVPAATTPPVPGPAIEIGGRVTLRPDDTTPPLGDVSGSCSDHPSDDAVLMQ